MNFRFLNKPFMGITQNVKYAIINFQRSKFEFVPGFFLSIEN